LICGENSYIGEYSSIQAYKGCKVVIGKYCRISHYVVIYTCNAITDQDFRNYNNLSISAGDVVIEDSCWIGFRVFINQGVRIGSNSVIGSHAVVTRNIPPHSIAVGAPAKVVKFKSCLSEEEVTKLVKEHPKRSF
jgi:maltose O-acetyltransferase